MGKKTAVICAAAAAVALQAAPVDASRTSRARNLPSTTMAFVGAVPRGGAKSEEHQKKKTKKRSRRKNNKAKEPDNSEAQDVKMEDVKLNTNTPQQNSTATSTNATADTSSKKTASQNSKAFPQSPKPKTTVASSTEKKETPRATKTAHNNKAHSRASKQYHTQKTKEKEQQQTPSSSSSSAQSSTTNKKPIPTIVQEILNHGDDYYKILGLTKQGLQQQNNSKTAESSTITKAYRRRAVQTHPDKTGGDRRAFDKVSEAYDVLSDETKRQLYDRFGKKGLEEGFGGGGGGFSPDLFRSFFGAGAGQQQQQAPTRNRTTRYQLDVTLEDLYKGMVRTVLVAPPDDRNPFFRQQQQQHQRQRQTKRVQVQVPRGALHGQSIVLSGEMDFDANETPGDLVFLVQQRPHHTFTRRGYDLAVSMPIRLKEAVCGVRRTIRHLDGREITIVSACHAASGKIRKSTGSATGEPILIQSGDVQVLKGQGMPKNRQGTEFGDLYVQYEVSMPSAEGTGLSEEERDELGRLLDKLEGVPVSNNKLSSRDKKDKDDAKVEMLSPASLSDFGVASGTPEVPPDPTQEDDEHHHGFSSFGGGRQFFYSSSSSSSMGSNPFFGMRQGPMFEEDDGSAQCRQM